MLPRAHTGMWEYLQEPYYCDDCDSWHLNLYDLDEDGTIYQGDQDGNWDNTVDEMPTLEETEKGWTEYAEWVAGTGRDPLDQFTQTETVKKTGKWQFQIVDSILGLIVRQAWLNHVTKYYIGTSMELPEHVIDYLNLKKDGANRYVMQDFKHLDDLRNGIDKSQDIKIFTIGGKTSLHCNIEKQFSRSSNIEQVKKSARLFLKRVKK